MLMFVMELSVVTHPEDQELSCGPAGPDFVEDVCVDTLAAFVVWQIAVAFAG